LASKFETTIKRIRASEDESGLHRRGLPNQRQDEGLGYVSARRAHAVSGSSRLDRDGRGPRPDSFARVIGDSGSRPRRGSPTRWPPASVLPQLLRRHALFYKPIIRPLTLAPKATFTGPGPRDRGTIMPFFSATLHGESYGSEVVARRAGLTEWWRRHGGTYLLFYASSFDRDSAAVSISCISRSRGSSPPASSHGATRR